MIETIKTSEVKIGMYVILPKSWFGRLLHPFQKTHFLIETEDELQQILHSGLEEIKIDPSCSAIVQDVECLTHPTSEIIPPSKWKSDKNISQQLKQVIHDQSLEPEIKAKAVYQESMTLMKSLFDNPSAGQIIQAKEAIGEVVDMILSEDDTTLNLLKIMTHDFYTYTHSVNVGVQSIALAKRLYGTHSDHDMHELGAGFFLHDLGKAKIDSGILNKQGRLDEKEMAIMRAHPSLGYSILKKANQLSRECALIAIQHHEREDGTGYPRQLKGDRIHDYSRICCIADVFDALTAERSYKRGLSTFEALKIMKDEMYGHFHHDIFENFVMLFH
ncbi:MAG: HD-GYP domain-containing protein [Candidatus Omnitrophota bacterium]